MGLVWSLVVGLLAGLIASWIMPGGANGCIWNTVLGLVGGLVGGWVFSLFGISEGSGFWGQLVVAVVGAIILIAIYNAIAKKKGKR
jgi:uncharacterized membrane protein YeaQ/YmgE (transglycosylase-associated protein family)